MQERRRWNEGRPLGPSALKQQQVWAVRFWLDQHRRLRDRALWATMIFADRLVAIMPEGDLLQIMHDGDPAATAAFEAAFATGKPVPFDVALACGGPTCRWLASVTFGGADLSTVYLGGLHANSIPYFSSPTPGLPMVHW